MDKVRENRLRQVAQRQGLRLEKSRRRDPRALTYGTYRLVNLQTSEVAELPTGYGMTLEAVEYHLNQDWR
jgi:hypothetical protein